MSDTVFQFDWTKENRENTFLSWIVLSVVGGEGNWDALDALPEGWTRDMRLEVSINGVALNTEHFVKRLEENFKYRTLREAERMLTEKLPGLDFDQALDDITAAQQAVRHAVNNYMVGLGKELGVEIYRLED